MIAEGARGALIGTAVEIGPEQHPEEGVVTLRVYLVFDDELDRLLAVSGDESVSPHVFETDGAALRQNCEGAAATCGCDARSDRDLGGDSWVSLGDDEITIEGFDDCGPAECCIAGDRFGGGGYFDGNPGTPVLPDESGRILVAQFSLPGGTCFSYRGTANYNLGGGDLTAEAFLVEHCVCAGDVDVSGAVDFDDLLHVLTNWGPYDVCPPHGPADLDKDCDVGFGDLLMVLSAWGPCE